MIKELTTQEVSACYGGVLVEHISEPSDAASRAAFVVFLGSLSMPLLIGMDDTAFNVATSIVLLSALTIFTYKHEIGMKRMIDPDVSSGD